MTAIVLRADARSLPLPDESVDLIITSPPYFSLRSYKDGGEHYAGQIGSEAHPQEFLEALWAVTAECWRVLKPTGSMFVNLGDKRSGSGAPGTTSGLTPADSRTTRAPGALSPKIQGERSGIKMAYAKAAFGRSKSKMLLPHRYAIGCEDGLADPAGIGWIVRQDIVWQKLNGLPESVRDRTRDGHEYWFHLTRSPKYFAALDEIREPHSGTSKPSGVAFSNDSGAWAKHRNFHTDVELFHPRGKIPGSVKAVATEPLIVPEHLGVDHFAAFPSEWPRWLIQGWAPKAVCTACDTPRAPVAVTTHELDREAPSAGRPKRQDVDGIRASTGFNQPGYPQTRTSTTITGYACACDDTSAPTRPAVVLDPFGGTGTTAMVAHALGRHGISVDLSADYCRLARWRIFESGGASRARERTNRAAQGVLL